MKQTWITADEHCPQPCYGDQLIVTLPQNADDWAGLPPENYLSALKRHGYLPLTVSGPFPDSAELTRLMQTASMEDANDYVLSAIKLLRPELGSPSHIVLEGDEDQSALMTVWETNPYWTLAIGTAKPGKMFDDPTVIVRLNARRH
ncbi:hypothetical protein SH203_01917 [Brevundimonas sp. SH203]|uniref:hypothetical protein n=1 Tax=Brevundimonas sp. SH203 TaxID=345167 RepID=UPI0009C87FD1|nr:hypothetical protein [Brevundimonas sp. SH203]GAW41509.1 hypothetical protein SH203_01917 [Brevundimonas sp. SH203]